MIQYYLNDFEGDETIFESIAEYKHGIISDEYLAEIDSFYLGKFITDEAARNRITQMLLDFYVANDGEIGNSRTLRKFAELMELQMEVLLLILFLLLVHIQ